MADTVLSIIAASVIPSSGATIRTGTVGAGTTVTAGKVLYAHTDGTLLLADSTSAVKAAVVGIALNGGSTGQVIRYVTEDPALVLGCTMTVGDTIYLSTDTPGGMTLTTVDLDSGEFVTVLGVCTVINSTINFKIIKSGAARTTNQV